MAIKPTTRTNEEIRVKEVRLVDETGKQLGIVPTDQAIERARSKTLDLVEVAPDGDPPVCRIMDYTKFLYDQKRKQKQAKKKTHRVDIKEIKLRPNIDPHDFGIKVRHAREFLEKGDKVKITVRYRPREMRHYEIGTQRLDKMVQDLADIAVVESSQRGNSQMRMQLLTLSPKQALAATTPKEKKEKDPAKEATKEAAKAAS